MFRINNKRNRYAPANPSFSRCNSTVDINRSCLNAVLLFLIEGGISSKTLIRSFRIDYLPSSKHAAREDTSNASFGSTTLQHNDFKLSRLKQKKKIM